MKITDQTREAIQSILKGILACADRGEPKRIAIVVDTQRVVSVEIRLVEKDISKHILESMEEKSE